MLKNIRVFNFVVVGYRRKFINDENFPIYGTTYIHVHVHVQCMYSMLPRLTCARYVLHKVTELLLIAGEVHGGEDVGSVAVVSMANYGNPNARDLPLEPLHCFRDLLTNLQCTGCIHVHVHV